MWIAVSAHSLGRHVVGQPRRARKWSARNHQISAQKIIAKISRTDAVRALQLLRQRCILGTTFAIAESMSSKKE
jgi:hypothetical protein